MPFSILESNMSRSYGVFYESVLRQTLHHVEHLFFKRKVYNVSQDLASLNISAMGNADQRLRMQPGMKQNQS
ncbi:MAG: hypothetical protein ACI9TH_005044 [Kiritimatiellia bacterium]|jgi:hypothetical protein